MYSVFANGESIYDPLNPSLLLFSPKVSLEFGKAGSCQFLLPPSNLYYESMKQMKTIITVEDGDGVEIFRGRVLNIKRGFNNLKEVYCEGVLAYLLDSVQKGVKFEGWTWNGNPSQGHGLFEAILHNHNEMMLGPNQDYTKVFEPGIVTIDRVPIKIPGSDDDDVNTGTVDYRQIAVDGVTDNWSNTFDYLNSCLVNYIGGYFQARYDKTEHQLYLDYWNHHNNEGSTIPTVEFGKNLLDLTEEVSVDDDDFFTVLIPLGDDDLMVGSVNNNHNEMADDRLVNKYGRIVRTHTFSNVDDASTLMEDAVRYMKLYEEPPVTIEAKAIDMHIIDPNATAIYIGNRANIKSPPHNINRTLICTQIEYDLTDPSNTSYTFGNPKQTLTQRYKEDSDESESETSSTASSAAGSAASAVSAETDTKIEEAVAKVQQQWSTSAEAITRAITNVKNSLKTKVGIDLDATTGQINIQSLATQVNSQGQIISQANSAITTLANDTQAKISNLVEFEADGKKRIASLELTANSLGSRIDAKADSVYIDTKILEVTGRISAAEGDIKILKAAKISASEIESIVNNMISIHTQNLTASGTIKGNLIYRGGDTVDQLVMTYNDVRTRLNAIGDTSDTWGSGHYHEVIENSDGTITIGYATKSAKHSFDITATKAYRDGVAAAQAAVTATISKYSIPSVGDESFDTTTHKTTVYVKATLSPGGREVNSTVVTSTKAYDKGYEKGLQDAQSPGSQAYQTGYTAGQESVEIITVTRDTTKDITYTTNAAGNHVAIVPLIASSNVPNVVASKTSNYYVPTETQYAEGWNGVGVRSVGRRDSTTYPDSYNRSTHKTTIYLRGTADNNNYLDTTVTTTTTAYEHGYEVGNGGVDFNSDGLKKIDDYQDISKKKVSMTVYAKLSNGNYQQKTFEASADKIYSTGETSGKKQTTVSGLSELATSANFTKTIWIHNDNAWYQSDGWLYGKFQISLSSPNINTCNVEVAIDGTKARAAGGSNVTLNGKPTVMSLSRDDYDYETTIGVSDKVGIQGTKWAYGRMQVNLTNGNSSKVLVWLNAEDLYELGYNQGKTDAEKSSVAAIQIVTTSGAGTSEEKVSIKWYDGYWNLLGSDWISAINGWKWF